MLLRRLLPQSENLAFARTSAKKTLFLPTTRGRNPPIPASFGVPAAWVCAWMATCGLTMSLRLTLIKASRRASAGVISFDRATSTCSAQAVGIDAMERAAVPRAARLSRRKVRTTNSRTKTAVTLLLSGVVGYTKRPVGGLSGRLVREQGAQRKPAGFLPQTSEPAYR